MIVLLYAITLFASATLLFVVQPMVGKMVLPLLGGTPAVWSTCMVFFQAALLGGYAYAHASTSWLGVARQARWHRVLLVLPLAVLPLGVDASLLRGGEASLVLDVLLVLTITVGLPFFVVSASAPLLQTWFTHTGHPAARDPYFLYAASNLGSMLALLAYPTLIEPKLSLRESGWLAQTHLWSAGYGVLAVLIVLCTLTVPRIASVNPTAAADEWRETIPLTRRLSWMAFAFVPSSLLLGATTYITTDIAAVPLLWVPPLAIYLLSFIIAFGRYPLWLQRAVESTTLPVILAVLFLLVSGFRQRIWISVLWHLLLLLVVALACHGTLARDRPGPSRLTEFYLLISVGGMLGGLLNALIAPAVFDSLAEYPLVMVLAGLLVGRSRMASAGQSPAYLLDVILGLGTGMLALVLYSDTLSLRFDFAFLTRALGLASGGPQWLDTLEQALNKLVVYAPPLILAFRWRRRPLTLGTALVGVLVVAGFVESRNIEQIHQARSFFGVLRVTRDRAETGYTELRHGTTLHGRQSLEGKRRGEPLSYYHRAGPMGQIFAEFDRRAHASPNRRHRPWHGHPGCLRPARGQTGLLRDRPAGAGDRPRPRVFHVSERCPNAGRDRARRARRCPRSSGAGTAGAARRALRPDRGGCVQLGRHSRTPAHAASPAAVSRDADAPWAARPAPVEPLSRPRAGRRQSCRRCRPRRTVAPAR